VPAHSAPGPLNPNSSKPKTPDPCRKYDIAFDEIKIFDDEEPRNTERSELYTSDNRAFPYILIKIHLEQPKQLRWDELRSLADGH
jgi:hypothetical protein